MGFEDLKYDFPKMPEEMRTMIEKEVNRQVKIEQPKFTNNKKTAGKVLAASVAAVILLGTTTFAGVSIYRLQSRQVAEHGVNVKIADHTDQASGTDAVSAEPVKLEDIPDVTMKVGYLPDGMVQTEEGKYSYEEALNKGGVSICFYRMDTGDGQFDMLHEDVLSSEDISLNGNEGVYLEYPQLYKDEIMFNQRIYVAFTDVHYVMEMYAASDVEKEEALKIAENITLLPVEESGSIAGAKDQGLVRAWNWSDYLESKKEQDKLEESDDEALAAAYSSTVAKEAMQHTHAVGESFSVENKAAGKNKGLTAKVSRVQVSDDLSLLEPSLIDEDLKKETDGNGRLRPATIQYIKEGGLDALSEVVKSREVAQKLVYVTVEYTNTGSSELKDVLFVGSLARIVEDGAQMRMSSGWSYEEPSDADEWTYAANRGLSSFSDMMYYDVRGGERNNNYIAAIQPGETAAVHMAWIVTEEELDRLYVSLDTYSGAGEFTDTALDMGYVDIRQ